MGIRAKLAVLSIISLIGMTISLSVFVHSIEKSLYEEKKAETQRLIETGMSIVNHFYLLEENGDLNREQARKYAMESLAAAIFGETGYFWINDIKGIMLMNPNTPKLVGKLVIDVEDASGNYPFRNIIEIASEGGGWVEYLWPRPNSSESHRKLSYVKLFRPWGWILGTGLYLDDMEREIHKATIKGFIHISVIFVVLIIASVLLSNRFMMQLKQIAIHDPLTTLFTRRYLNESIPIFLSKHDRNLDKFLSVVFFDIDHFKDINDCFGHALGDQVLADIGKTIKNIIRKGDLGVRYGGEEFVVVMLCNARDDAIRVAERIREQSHRHVFNRKNTAFSVTLSAGISFREEGEDFDCLLKRADKNLYMAKNTGRNRLVS